jgi:hypothetical protein
LLSAKANNAKKGEPRQHEQHKCKFTPTEVEMLTSFFSLSLARLLARFGLENNIADGEFSRLKASR